jgi:glyoxylase-like metal-dependent hydrolase (beta-lactamase superfamily II)
MRGVILCTIMIVALAACNHGQKTAAVQPMGDNKATIVPLESSNVYFIETQMGFLMVDTGMSAREKAVNKLFSRAGVDAEDVILIIITHVHPDHVVGLASAKGLTGARVLCHKDAAEYIEKGNSEPIVAHSPMGSFLAAVTPKKFKGVVPDLIMEKEFDLKAYGIAGKIVHTPGHSPGSITIILDNGEALIGDQVRGESTELSLGQFYEDKDLLLQNLEKIANFNSRIIYMSHGTYTDPKTLSSFIEEQKKMLTGEETS